MALGTWTLESILLTVRALVQQYTFDKVTTAGLSSIVCRKVMLIFQLMDKTVKENWYADTAVLVPALDATTGYYAASKPATMWDHIDLTYFIWNDRTALEYVDMKHMDERINNHVYDKTYFGVRGDKLYFSWQVVPTGTLALSFVRLPVTMDTPSSMMDLPDPFIDVLAVMSAIDAVIGSNIDAAEKQAALQVLYLKEDKARSAAGLPMPSTDVDVEKFDTGLRPVSTGYQQTVQE